MRIGLAYRNRGSSNQHSGRSISQASRYDEAPMASSDFHRDQNDDDTTCPREIATAVERRSAACGLRRISPIQYRLSRFNNSADLANSYAAVLTWVFTF